MPRRLGQHFLRPASVERLVRLIAPASEDVFIEIGSGSGALTLPLATRASRVIALELDATLADRLRPIVPANVELIVGDALSLGLTELLPVGGRLVGNLPYYISSPLLRRFLDLRGRARDLHVMVQEEVAERVAAAPGSRAYGILSVLYSLWTEVDIPLHFGPEAFRPAPQVRSAVLRARFRPSPEAAPCDPDALETLLRAAFTRRRRTLENNLRDSYANLKENLRLLKIEGTRRAETLTVGEFIKLAETLEHL